MSRWVDWAWMREGEGVGIRKPTPPACPIGGDASPYPYPTPPPQGGARWEKRGF